MNYLVNLLLLLLLFTITTCQRGNAFCTYHAYTKTSSLRSVACSDGAYGLLKWGYSDISQMFPYVTAWEQNKWNSPKCGTCIKISFGSKSIYVTAIDRCEPASAQKINNANHFDLSKEAFSEVFGASNVKNGKMTGKY